MASIVKVAIHDGATAAAHEEFCQAAARVNLTGDDAARTLLRRRAVALRIALKAAAEAAPELERDADEAATEVERIVGKVRPRSGLRSAAGLKPNWWDRLFKMAAGDDELRAALAAFQDAAATGDPDLINQTAKELKDRVSNRVSPSQAQEFADRLNGAVRRMTTINPTADGAKALVTLHDFVDQLDSASPVRGALDKLRNAVRDQGGRWLRVANILAGMKKAENPEQARAMIWRVKGLLGEMLAMVSGEYRQLTELALSDAELLARRLNAKAIAEEGLAAEAVARKAANPSQRVDGVWEVVTIRSQIRAPSKGSARLAAFYDDAVIVRRFVAGKPEGEAFVVLATQVKSGDWSSAGVVKQIRDDIIRELSGRIELENQQMYTLVGRIEGIETTRVFVGTSLPPAAEATAASVPIRAVILPMGGEELESVARAFLEALHLL
jgi:hypothetical protein